MENSGIRPVANGLRTDHPISGLPFVDDSHIPVEDPLAVEAVGRHEGGDTWGREDSSEGGGWTAFTTDPVRHDLAWSVRWHPEHGRSVVLYRDEDASSVHMTLQGPALLSRSGGYWWDGTAWYRPPQIWDAAGQDYLRRRVPAATTITAADVLLASGDPAAAAVLNIEDVVLDAPPPVGPWLDDLALWAAAHGRGRGHDTGRQLSDSVVSLIAPELLGDQLIGLTEVAAAAGVAASTLRAYIARDEASVPAPQATVAGRSVWSRAVAAEWAERRRSDDLGELVTAGRPGAAGQLSDDASEVRTWFARLFFDRLWRNPERRRRWALRARTETAVRGIADELALDVAANLRQIIRLDDLASTIRYAVLGDFRTSEDRDRALNPSHDRPHTSAYTISRPIGRMLGWLIRHNPNLAAATIGDIVGEAGRTLDISRPDSAYAIRACVHLDGGLDADRANAYLDHVLSPLIEGAAVADPGRR